MRPIAMLLLCAVVAACGPPYEDLPMTPTQGFAHAEDALRRGEYAAAVTGLSDYISSGQETFRARAFYELAQAQYGLENYEAALDTLDDLQDEYPKQKWAQPDALRGDVYYAIGRRVDAILAWQSGWDRSTDSEKQFLRARIEEAVDELTPAESSRLADDLTNDELRAMLGPHEATAHAKHASAAPYPLPAPAAAPPPPPADLDINLPADTAADAPAATTGGGSMAAEEVRGSAAIGAGELGIASGEALDPGIHVGCLLPLSAGGIPADGLDDDRALHVRMQAAEILERARRRKRERVLVLGVERLRAEVTGRDHRVRDVVLVDPGDGVADLHGELLRAEGEVVDLHLELGGVRRPRQGRGER